MSDQDSSASASPKQTQDAAPRFTLHNHYIKDLSFESPNAPLILASLKEAPKVDVRLDVGARHLQERIFEVIIRSRVDATSKDPSGQEITAFVLELEFCGVASIRTDITDDAVEELLVVEAAARLFPFVRRLIADITRDGGFPPMLLNTVDFLDLYRARKAKDEDSTLA